MQTKMVFVMLMRLLVVRTLEHVTSMLMLLTTMQVVCTKDVSDVHIQQL